jgi:hypothetical protein
MTLCIAWIRETGETEELVFATDSILTGGEKWNGVKLFELPRRDCLLCFAGETYRAYPLILNLISTIKHNEKLQDPKLDIQDVLYGIVEIFSELITAIFEKPIGNTAHIGTEAKFLFGGWSWKESRFRVWRLYYSIDAAAFLFKEETSVEEKSRVCVFLGDPDGNLEAGEKNISAMADKKYKEELIKRDKFDGKLDMEPLHVIAAMSRDKTIYEVDGSLQVAKVYKSGTNEFFGVMWPSIKGTPSFLGKHYGKHSKPRVKYFDPDTCEIIEDEIPKCLVNLDSFSGTDDYDFLIECYSQEDNFLKQDISDSERERLIAIFREHSYREFLKIAEENQQLKQ